MYDVYPPPRRGSMLPAVLAVLAALAALALAAAAFVQARARAAEVRSLRAEIAAVEQRVEVERATLAVRLQTAEAALRRRESGIAPLAARVLRSVFTIETDDGLGTGFVAWQDERGSYLLTADHVVDGHGSSFVTISRKGGSWQGEILGRDARHDLALVRMSGKPKGAEPLWQKPNTTRPRQGEKLLLVGSPFGLAGSVTSGIVSRVTRAWIQTDAAANPGSSGGPALDESGRIVGVLVSGGGQNVNFAVPIARACEQLRRCER